MLKVLIVEDEPMILKGITFLLQEYEYPNNEVPIITTAMNGLEANQLLKENSYDFVFTDIKMPEMSGLELINKWSAEKSITQWVIISGFNDFNYAKEAIQNGVKDYLLKPITKKKISETIGRLIKERKKQFDSFISISKFQQTLANLLDLIWNLDEQSVKQYIYDRTSNQSLESINQIVYQRYLEELLELLVFELLEKGIKDLKDQQLLLDGETKLELIESFISRCEEMIDVIRIKRKGNIMDPIEVAKDYIQSNINDRLNLSDVADKLGFNPTYFSQLFKKETGESFVAYRRAIRMERAKQLLEKDEMRIIDISNEIGYGDLPHFTKSFKKYTGCTPSEYKNQLGITT